MLHLGSGSPSREHTTLTVGPNILITVSRTAYSLAPSLSKGENTPESTMLDSPFALMTSHCSCICASDMGAIGRPSTGKI